MDTGNLKITLADTNTGTMAEVECTYTKPGMLITVYVGGKVATRVELAEVALLLSSVAEAIVEGERVPVGGPNGAAA